jgi:ATP-dependent helicase/nuclease subunit A
VILEDLYKKAVSHPDPEEWLRDRASDYTAESEEELFGSAWMQYIILTAAEKIKDLRRQYEQLLDFCSLPDGPDLYIPLFQNELRELSAIGDVPGAEEAGRRDPGEMEELWERIIGILNMDFKSLPKFIAAKHPEVDPAKKDTAMSLRNSAKEDVKKLAKKYKSAETGRILERMGLMREAVQAVSDLTIGFLRYFADVKREKNVIDFVDLEHLALKILTVRGEDGVYRPGRAAMAYRQYFDEILIDEYQDSNEV